MAEWVQSALPEGDSWSDNYHRQAYGAFLLALLEAELDDEAFLRISRETGRLHDLVDRLLTLNRANEAEDAARGANDYELIDLADLFVSHGQSGLGEQLVRERTESSNDSRLTVWLKERAEEHGDAVTALAFAEVFFWQRPSTLPYADMKRLAQQLEQWAVIRARCLGRLKQEGNLALVTEIYALEQEIDRALETLQLCSRQHRWGRNTLALKVAQAAEESRPRDAVCLYLE